MNLSSFFVLLISAYQANAALQCYSCGYRKVDGGEAEEIPETPFCNDFAKPGENLETCGNENDCCASMKFEQIRLNEDTGANQTEIVGRHGCESEMNSFHTSHYTCSDHRDSCFNVDLSTLPDSNDTVTVTDVEMCFCSTERCNTEDPIFPESTTTATTPGSGSFVTASLSLISLTVALLLVKQ